MRVPHVVAAAAVGMLALAACSSGGGSYGSTSSQPARVASDNPAPATTGRTAFGDTLVDTNGRTLYGRTVDTNGVSSCVGACAAAWPPVIVASATLPSQ